MLLTGCTTRWTDTDERPRCVDPATDTVSEGLLCGLPEVDAATLSPAQTELWAAVQEAYDAQHPATVYSQGVVEPWCADFVSWVFNEAGHPFTNPSSGSWRIPGTFTLAEHFGSQQVFHTPDEPGFVPQLGDVVIYTKDSSVWTQHTNIVLDYDGTWLVTIGGNQPRGNVTVYRHRWDNPGLAIRGLGRPLPS